MTILRNLKNLFTAVATIDSFKSWNLQKHPNNSMYLNGEFPYNSHDNIKLYKDITISNSSVTTQNVRAKCAINVYLNTDIVTLNLSEIHITNTLSNLTNKRFFGHLCPSFVASTNSRLSPRSSIVLRETREVFPTI